MKNAKPKYDEEIMNQLLEEPGVKENVEKMTPTEVELFKELLVKQGTYIRYVSEQQNKKVKEMIRDALSPLKNLGKR